MPETTDPVATAQPEAPPADRITEALEHVHEHTGVPDFVRHPLLYLFCIAARGGFLNHLLHAFLPTAEGPYADKARPAPKDEKAP